MARIAGVNIPTQKRVVIALQYIHGIGQHYAKEICGKVGLAEGILNKPAKLSESEFDQVKEHPVVGEDAELAAKRARAIRHALAEYELPSYPVTPGRPLGEALAR